MVTELFSQGGWARPTNGGATRSHYYYPDEIDELFSVALCSLTTPGTLVPESQLQTSVRCKRCKRVLLRELAIVRS